MIALKSFIEQIIYIAIISIIIEIIMPKGNTKKYVYVILSLFVLLNILSPVFNVIKDVDMQSALDNILETISGNVESSNISIEDFSGYTNDKVKKELEEKLKTELKIKFLDIDMKVKEVNIKKDASNNFKSLEVEVENLEYLGENKISRIADAIKLVAESYGIDENNVVIIEGVNK